MPDEEVDAIMDDLHERIVHAVDELAAATVENTRGRIAIPVERTPRGVIRSNPGEPPRKDTGMLYNSIQQGEMVEREDGVGTIVGSDVHYARDLEYGTRRVDPRPYMSESYKEIADNAADFVAREMKQ